MRELLIVVADFYLPADAAASASKVFTRTAQTLSGLSNVARYGTSSSLTVDWRARLAQWIGREDLAHVAPANVAAAVLDPKAIVSQGMQWLAEPVHLVTGLRSVHLDHAGVLSLDTSTQAQLVQAFEKDFGSAPYRLCTLPSGRFLITGPQAPRLQSADPARSLGLPIDGAAPRGEGASELKRLAAEIEMWLHEHPINAARARQKLQPISTLWLWGGGEPLAAHNSRNPIDASKTGLFGDDPFVDGLARLMGIEARRVVDLGALQSPGCDRAALVVHAFRLSENSSIATSMQALEFVDRHWIAPAFEAVKRGKVQRLSIIANDRCLTVSSRDRLKFWRRPRSAI